MGKTRGVRDGSGPAKNSYARKVNGIGRRKALGQPCPVKRPAKKK